MPARLITTRCRRSMPRGLSPVQRYNGSGCDPKRPSSCDATQGGKGDDLEVTREEVLVILHGGDFAPLIGVLEDIEVEFKRQYCSGSASAGLWICAQGRLFLTAG
jgi:hypothetical protein